jgi:hypothetical protein
MDSLKLPKEEEDTVDPMELLEEVEEEEDILTLRGATTRNCSVFKLRADFGLPPPPPPPRSHNPRFWGPSSPNG